MTPRRRWLALLGLTLSIGLTASSIAIMGADKGGAAGSLEATVYELGTGFGITCFGVFMSSVFSRAVLPPATLTEPQRGAFGTGRASGSRAHRGGEGGLLGRSFDPVDDLCRADERPCHAGFHHAGTPSNRELSAWKGGSSLMGRGPWQRRGRGGAPSQKGTKGWLHAGANPLSDLVPIAGVEPVTFALRMRNSDVSLCIKLFQRHHKSHHKAL